MSIMDTSSLRNSIQDALDDILSTHSSLGRKTRALAALEYTIALVCVPKGMDHDFNGFLRSQDTFECNVPSRLLSWISASTSQLEGLSGREPAAHDRHSEIFVLSSQLSQALSIIQGIALNHSSSKALLGQKYSLEVLLDLLITCRHISSSIPLTKASTNTPNSKRSKGPADTRSIPPLSSAVLDTLLCILVDRPPALRKFEQCNGVQAIVKILKTAGTPREIRMKCLEFLYFYLMDESPPASLNGNVSHSKHHIRPSSPTKMATTPPSPTKAATTSPFGTKTAPSTPTRISFTHTPSQSQSASKLFALGAGTLGSSSPSSRSSDTWKSISSFESDISSSIKAILEPEDASSNTTAPIPSEVVPKTPSKSTYALPDLNTMATEGTSNGKIPHHPSIILRKDVDIDYVPMSPKKPKVDTSSLSSVASKLRELSTGSRSMPIIGTLTKGQFESPWHYGHSTDLGDHGERKGLGYDGIRTAEEKRAILGGMLGNVDALVEGVRKAGIWGLS